MCNSQAYRVLCVMGAFLLDVLFYGLFYYPVVSCVRVLYYAWICTRATYASVIFAGLFVLIESFLYSSCCAADLIVMIPTSLVAWTIINMVDSNKAVLIILILAALCVHYAVIDYGLFKRPLSPMFTWYNLLMYGIIILFVVYYKGGSQGNRAKTY